MAELNRTSIHAFFAEVGRRYGQPAQLSLLGGIALCLLGSLRPTLDIDQVGDDLHKNELQLLVEVEAVPIEQFIPVPVNAPNRHLLVGRFDQLELYIFDLYAMALNKLDRGFDTDIDDIVFLLHHNLIDLATLEAVTATALEQAIAFELNRTQTQAHLAAVRRRLAANQ